MVVQQDFVDNGYDYQTLRVDASKCFVPQKRKRLFVVGVLMDSSKHKLRSDADFTEYWQRFCKRMMRVSVTPPKLKDFWGGGQVD